MQNKTLGDKIMEILELRGMTQSELAKKANISKGVLNEICNNKRTSAMLDTVLKIAKALGIRAAYFIEDDTLGPAEILPHLTTAEKNFLIEKDNLPWIKLSQEAKKKGVNPERLRQLIDIMTEG